jgi:hypothetical protein
MNSQVWGLIKKNCKIALQQQQLNFKLVQHNVNDPNHHRQSKGSKMKVKQIKEQVGSFER